MPAYDATEMPPALSQISNRLFAFFERVTDARAGSFDGEAATGSSRGPYRERNEDRCAALHIRRHATGQDYRLGIVCDGLGGLAGGDEAATLAISTFIMHFAFDSENSVEDRLRRACLYANEILMRRFRAQAGTTMTAVALSNSGSAYVHAGDSRLYLVTDDREVILITRDDTVNSAIQVHKSEFDEDELDNRLLQFVGIGRLLEPTVKVIQVDRSAMLLLTSDGAHFIGKKALKGIVSRQANPLDIVRKAIFTADAFDTQDNASIVCLSTDYAHQNDDWQNGLTIEISSLNNNLEIFVPEFALKGSLIPPAKNTRAARVRLIRDKSGDTPSVKPKRLIKKTVKAQSKKDTPMDVMFDSGEE